MTPCKRCLLSSYDPMKMYESVQIRISLIDDDERTCEDEYRERLRICEGCDDLSSGSCLQCGCFVELRAAYKDMHCPSVKKLW